jgi:hypothetical protein
MLKVLISDVTLEEFKSLRDKLKRWEEHPLSSSCRADFNVGSVSFIQKHGATVEQRLALSSTFAYFRALILGIIIGFLTCFLSLIG